MKVEIEVPGPGTLTGTEFAVLGEGGEHPKAQRIAAAVAKARTDGRYLIGFVLTAAALAYFKEHKDNPPSARIRIAFRPAGGGVTQVRTLGVALKVPSR